MKQILTLFLVMSSVAIFAQTQTPNQTNTKAAQTSPRTVKSSEKTQVHPINAPYDMNDKYMGRKSEFLYVLTTTDLPADFPVYDKQWGVKEYNAVVNAYYINHMDILKEAYKQKLQQQINAQKAK